MAMSVIRTKRGLVKPAEETPLTTVLDLSAIDRLPVLRCNARTLHVFKHGPEATRVIREALSKALVPYYPLAGRLKESKPVEASSDCTLRSVNFFDDVHSIPYDHLLPDAIPESQCIHPLVQIQRAKIDMPMDQINRVKQEFEEATLDSFAQPSRF
ncbi:hypothetical protein JHK87_008080 [Glycine soja]|nr:hypothetical protein JHK87_008080 [Glycine soja]